MSEYKDGEFIIYQNGDCFQIGKIKRVTDDGAFVFYSEGDTAAKTPLHCMHKIENAYVIKGSSLGGERKARRAKGADFEHSHGRLIDADDLDKEINKICDRYDAGLVSEIECLNMLLSAFRSTPDIIPAEE